MRELLPAIQGLHQVRTLTPAVPMAQVEYGVGSPLIPGERYVVVACWSRHASAAVNDAVQVALVDVDLEVFSGTTRLARSASRGNSYERVGFRVPAQVTQVSLRVSLASVPAWLTTQSVRLVARRFEPDLDPAAEGVQFTPTHAGTGTVESLSAGPLCTTVAPDLQPVRTVPTSYADAWGSRPFLSDSTVSYPTYTNGLDLGDAFQGNRRLHFVIRGASVTPANPGQMGGSVDIGGIAFRTWRPFSITGPLAVSQIHVEQHPAGPVTATSLQFSPGSTAVGGPMTLSGDSAGWVSPRFDRFAVVMPFDTMFRYTGGNLHVWITLDPFATVPADFVVDAVDDAGVTDYGCLFSGSTPKVGLCPVVALLPAPAPVTLAPQLRVFGEPALGRSLLFQIEGAQRWVEDPPGTPPVSSGPVAVALVGGGWTPGVPGTNPPCAQHVLPVTSSIVAVSDRFGWARWSPWQIPIDATLLHLELGFQAWALTPVDRFSNGLRITLGGGL